MKEPLYRVIKSGMQIPFGMEMNSQILATATLLITMTLTALPTEDCPSCQGAE